MPQNKTQDHNGVYWSVPLELGDPSPGQDGGPASGSSLIDPPRASPTDLRAVRDVHTAPHLQFYDPNALFFPNASLFGKTGGQPPGAGGYASMGVGMVAYANAPQWDRSKIAEAGPVREFFRRVLFDNRTKHL